VLEFAMIIKKNRTAHTF